MINFYSMILEAEQATEQTSLFSADQMGGYAVTILVTIINVAVAFIIIKMLIFKPILGVIKKREAQILEQIDDTQTAKKQAEEYAAVSKKQIDEARAEASAILEEARADAEEQSQMIRRKADEEAASIIERAENEAARMKRVALEQMKDEISDLAVEVAGRVIGDVVEHDKLTSLAVRHTEEIIGEKVD